MGSPGVAGKSVCSCGVSCDNLPISPSAFDPIFYLHHCNVDRMLSLWSAINPEVWVSRGPSENGTFTIPGNSVIDASTSMLGTLVPPFWNSQTAFWPSSATTLTSNLNYSYPEFNGLNLGSPNTVRVAIANYIRQHYGGFSPFGSTVPDVSLLAQPPAAEGAPAPAAQDVAQVTSAAVTSSVKPAAADTTPHAQSHASHHPHPPHGGDGPVTIYDWAVRVHAKKYELGHGYVVLIFLGEVPDDPSQWRTCHSFVGAHCAFVNPDAEQCGNCREQAELVVEGFVHLNPIIAKRSGLSSYEPNVVAPYLRDNLHWRVQAVCSFSTQFAHFESA